MRCRNFVKIMLLIVITLLVLIYVRYDSIGHRPQDITEPHEMIIDRFEGDFAVIETSEGLVDIARSKIPPGAKEGTVLLFVVDNTSTDYRSWRIEREMNRLFKD